MTSARLVVAGLVLASSGATAQVRLDLAGALVTDRQVGVRADLPAARGPGLAGTITARMGRVEGEVTGVAARIHLPGAAPVDANWQTFTQLGVRLRYRLLGPLALEGGLHGRRLDPDPDGEGTGFVTTGAFIRWQVSRGTSMWGRLAFVPWSTFRGGGGSGFAAETGVGIEVALSRRVWAAIAYGFQRLDRELTAPDGSSFRSPLEHDVLRVGIRWVPGRATGDMQ